MGIAKYWSPSKNRLQAAPNGYADCFQSKMRGQEMDRKGASRNQKLAVLCGTISGSLSSNVNFDWDMKHVFTLIFEKGDDGGPLIWKFSNSSKEVLIGVLDTYNTHCKSFSLQPFVFINVVTLQDWIDSVIKNENTSWTKPAFSQRSYGEPIKWNSLMMLLIFMLVQKC